MTTTEKLLLTFVFALLSSCASLTEKGERVHVYSDAASVAGCRQVGKVQTSSWGTDGGAILMGNHNSSVHIRNAAAEYGNALLLLKDDSNMFGSDRVGIVYQCDEVLAESKNVAP